MGDTPCQAMVITHKFKGACPECLGNLVYGAWLPHTLRRLISHSECEILFSAPMRGIELPRYLTAPRRQMSKLYRLDRTMLSRLILLLVET